MLRRIKQAESDQHSATTHNVNLMSTARIVMLTVAIVVVLGIILLIYTIVTPTVKDMSDHQQLKPFLGKPTALRSAISIYKNKVGGFRFSEYVMSSHDEPGEKIADLPVGAVIILRNFKTYRSNIGGGGTELFALGEYTPAAGGTINFEYDWESTDVSLYTNQVPDLPLAPWQDSTAVRINVKK
jgi:hypothetical protein